MLMNKKGSRLIPAAFFINNDYKEMNYLNAKLS